MASSLMDTINTSLKAQSEGANQIGAPSDQQAQIQALANAKSGKAVGPGVSPSASNLTEQASTATAKAGLDQLRSQGQLQSTEASGKLSAIDQSLASQSLDQQQSFNEHQQSISNQATALANSFKQESGKLELSKSKAKVEQLGFQVRLGNQQYVDQLQNEGQRSRLDDATSFNEALTRSVFSDEQDLFASNLDFRRQMSMNDVDFNKEMGNIDLDYAVEVAQAGIKAENQQAIYKGISGLASGGAQAYASSGKSSGSSTPSSSSTSNMTDSNSSGNEGLS